MPVVTNGFSYHSAEPSRPSEDGFVTLKSLTEESEGNYDYDDKDVDRADRLIFRDSKYKVNKIELHLCKRIDFLLTVALHLLASKTFLA